MIGHIAPEAALGGPIGLVEEGDEIVIDVDRKALDLDVPPTVLAERRARWTPPAPRYAAGVMAKYAALVSTASEGAVTTGPRMRANLSVTGPRPLSSVTARRVPIGFKTSPQAVDWPTLDGAWARIGEHDVFDSVWMNDHITDIDARAPRRRASRR